MVLLSVLGSSAAAWADPVAEVRQADQVRVDATLAGDVSRLSSLLSERLTYGHSDGRLQTKAEFLQAVASRRIQYHRFDYEDPRFERISDDVVTMTGRVHLKATAGTENAEFTLRFLAVWRRERAGWQLCAYQSARSP